MTVKLYVIIFLELAELQTFFIVGVDICPRLSLMINWPPVMYHFLWFIMVRFQLVLSMSFTHLYTFLYPYGGVCLIIKNQCYGIGPSCSNQNVVIW